MTSTFARNAIRYDATDAFPSKSADITVRIVCSKFRVRASEERKTGKLPVVSSVLYELLTLSFV